MENYKTVANYAKLKNVSTTTVYNWIEKGTVKTDKVDGVLFVIVD